MKTPSLHHFGLLSAGLASCILVALVWISGPGMPETPTSPASPAIEIPKSVHTGQAAGAPVVAAPEVKRAIPAVTKIKPTPANLPRQQAGTAWGREANAECRAFSAWANDYAAAPASERTAMEARGVQLAADRREAVKKLIATDPAAALAAAVPMKIRSALPEAIVAKLEQRVSGRGDLTVLATVPAPGQTIESHYRRVASIGGQHYAAHVFGERAEQRTTEHDSLHGIAVDGELAILESPLRLLEDGEQPSAGKKIVNASTAQHSTTTESAPVFESGDTVYVGCCQQHVAAQQQEWLAASGGSVPASGGPNATAYRTTGNRSILVMVAKLSGGPSMITQAQAQAGIDQIATWAQQASFQQLTFTTKTVTTELTLPKTKTEYQALGETTGPQTLMTDARAAAVAASAAYDTNNFDFDIVVYENTFAFSGLGTVGGKKCWIQLGTVGQFETSTTAHELGHNLGLNHAGVWVRPSGSTNPIDPAGNFQDYGSLFDALGLGGYPKGHYSVHYKRMLGWVPSANIHTVTSPTTSALRIYAHDTGVSLDPARKYGLRVAVADTVGAGRRDYWMDVRTLYTDRPNSQNGVTLQWGDEKGSPQGSALIDTTPDSNTSQGTLGDFVDAPLAVGSSFTDSTCGVTITPIASGGSGSDKYVDVQVTTPDADLSALALSTGTLSPSFSASTLSYSASVSSSTTSVTVTPTASASSSTIQVRVNGGTFSTVASGTASSALALNPGPNTVDVKVTATGGLWSKTYSVSVSTMPAIAGTGYGPIPETAGTSRDITFTISGLSGTVSNVLVDFTLNPAHTYSSDVKAVLIAPDSTQHVVASFTHLNDNSRLAGPYLFSDLATGTLGAAITATAGGVDVPSGSFRTQNNNETATSLVTTFSGKAPNGTWTLRFTDLWAGDTGTVSAANLYLATTTPAAPELAVFNGASTAAGDERTDNTGTQTFASTNVGSTSSAQTFTVKNTGTADITGLTISKTGDFTITQPAVTTLAPDATTTFTVSFAPTARGTRTGVISIASNDADENPFEINVSGAGLLLPVPVLSYFANGNSVFFNAHNEPLPGAPIPTSGGVVYARTDTNAAPLIGGSGVTNLETELVNSGFDGLSAEFTPGVSYTFRAYLINADGVGYSSPETVTFSPEIAVFNGASTAAVDQRTDNTGTFTFANTNVGSTSSAQTFTIKNVGNLALAPLAVTKTGDFTVTQPFGSGVVPSLEGDASTTFTVTFAPTAAGTRTGVISIASNDADENPFEINVSGTGVALNPPSMYSFQAATADTSSATLRGQVMMDNGSPITEVGAVLALTSVNADPRVGGAGVTKVARATPTMDEFSVLAAGLTPGTSYSFRAYGTNAGGTSYSALGTFSTQTALPKLSVEQPAGTALSSSVIAWGYNDFDQTTVPTAAQSGVQAIAAGIDHTVALKTDGRVIAWGLNDFGQTTVPTAAQSGVKAIAAGDYHTVALKTDGSVVAWGHNSHGQITVPTAAQSGVQTIAAGGYHTVALKTDGSVVAWGGNDDGQTTVPTAAQSGVQAIAAGNAHTVALKTDGSVIAWGLNNFGRSTVPTDAQSGVQAIAAGYAHTMVLKTDGSVVAWGYNGYGQTTVPTAAQSGVQAIAAGGYHTVGLKTDGSVVAWGYDEYGQTTVPTTAQSGVRAIAAGGYHTVALKVPTVGFGSQVLATTSAAQTFTLKNTGTGPLTISSASVTGGNASDFSVDTGSMASSIAPGNSTTVSLTFTPSAVGPRQTTLRIVNNDSTASTFDIVLAGTGLATPEIAVFNGASTAAGDERTDNTGTFTFANTAVGSSSAQTFTLKNTGTADLTGLAITTTGDFTITQPAVTTLAPDATTTFTVSFVPTAAGTGSGVVSIASNDGDENPFEINVSGSTTTGTPELRIEHPAGTALSSSVLAWGNNGNGETNVPAAAQSGMISIAAGAYHTVALKDDGSVIAWGYNGSGQTTVPAAAQGGVTAIAAGAYHTVALKNDDSVIAWGRNDAGQTLVPAAAQSGVTAVAAGGAHTVALKNDGSVIAWGQNTDGQTTVPATAQSGVRAIAAGGSHTVVLKEDGSVIAWGRNDYGQTTVPVAAQTGVTAVAAGSHHTVALLSDGSVIAWGQNADGQTTVPAAAQSGVTAVAAGGAHSMALKNDGSVIAWGDNGYGQTTVPAAAQTGVSAIAAGGASSVALKLPVIKYTTPSFTIKTITLRNGGSAPLTIASVSVLNRQVSVADTTGMATTIAPAGSTSLDVGYLAFDGATWSKPTILRVVSNDPKHSPMDIELAYSGEARYDLSSLALNVGTLTPAFSPGITSYTATVPSGTTSVTLTTTAATSFQARINGGNFTPVAYGSATSTFDLQPGPNLVEVRSIDGMGTQLKLYTVTISLPTESALSEIELESPAGVPVRSPVWTNGYFDRRDLAPLRSITAGYSHTVALTQDGKIIAWGNNSYGQTAVPPDVHDIVAISAMNNHTLALGRNGVIYGWGATDPSYPDWFETTALPPADLGNDFIAISAGWDYGLAVRADHTVVGWGHGKFNTTLPPAGLDHVIAVSAGGAIAAALKDDHTVVTWGNGVYFMNPPPAGLNDVIQISAGAFHCVALKSDGTVVAWGDPNDTGAFSVPDGLTHVVQVKATSYGGYARRSDGSIVSWGDVPRVAGDSKGAQDMADNGDSYDGILLTVGAMIDFGNVGVGGASTKTILVKNSGTAPLHLSHVAMAGRNAADFTFTTPPDTIAGGGSANITVTFRPGAADYYGATLHIESDDSDEPVLDVSMQGNGSGTPDLPALIAPTITGLVPGQATLGGTITSDGNSPITERGIVWTTSTLDQELTVGGVGAHQVIASGTDMGVFTVNVSALPSDTDIVFKAYATNSVGTGYSVASSFHTLPSSSLPPKLSMELPSGHALGASVLAWGDPTTGISRLPGNLNGVLQVAAGYRHALALRYDGTVVAWGDDPYGYGPTFVPAGLTDVVSVSAVAYSSYAVKSDGSVVAWGLNEPANADSYHFTNVQSIAPSRNGGFVVLRKDGSILSVEYGGGPAPDDTGYTAIATGNAHALALKDGHVIAWGNNNYGQLNVPEGLDHVVAIAAGSNHGLALKDDGTVVQWGTFGIWTPVESAYVPGELNHIVAIHATPYGAMAVKDDGSILSWGDLFYGNGGDTIEPPADIQHVSAFASNSSNVIALQPGIGFGRVAVAGGAVTQTLTLRNTGSDPLTISEPGIVADESTTPEFTLTNAPAASVLPGQSTTLTISFTPVHLGRRSATLHFLSNDPDHPASDILLNGIGAEPSLPPSGQGFSRSIAEDTLLNFSRTDWGFDDTHGELPSNSFIAVKIVTLPDRGVLQANGVTITVPGTLIPAQAQLSFVPVTNDSGTPYTSFTFQVVDDGLDGTNIDPEPKNVTISVTPSTEPPVGGDRSITVPGNGRHVFTPADFAFSDPNDTPPNHFTGVRITNLPESGYLTLNGLPLRSFTFEAIGPEVPSIADVSFIPQAGKVWKQSSPQASWDAIACSADGMKLIAIGRDGDTPSLYRSIDGGKTWSVMGDAGNWCYVASSADGMILYATTWNGVGNGMIYKSTNGGDTWSALTPNGGFSTIACSANGLIVYAGTYESEYDPFFASYIDGGKLHASTDGGVTWSIIGDDNAKAAVACSADGSTVAVGSPFDVQVSHNFGATFSAVYEASSHVQGLTCSSDGQKLAVALRYDGVATSSDGGSHWSLNSDVSVNSYGVGLAASSDGRTLLLASGYSRLQVSYDQGASWIDGTHSYVQWLSAAISADGSHMFAGSEDSGNFAGAAVSEGSGYTELSDGHVIVSEATTDELVYYPALPLIGINVVNNEETLPDDGFMFRVMDDGDGTANVSEENSVMFIHYGPDLPEPTFTDLAATDITPTSATLHGTLVNEDGVAIRSLGFNYQQIVEGNTYYYTIYSDSNQNGPFSASVPDVLPGIPVVCVAFAELSNGSTIYSEEFSFIPAESRPVAVGNLVFWDKNNNGHADAGEGINGVTVQLYGANQEIGESTPLRTATTADGGFWLIDNLVSGSYRLAIPPSMFAEGAPLWMMKSVAGFMTIGDDDLGEKGLGSIEPEENGERTDVFTLIAGSAPTGELGLKLATQDEARDIDIDLTRDLGFVDRTEKSESFDKWKQRNGGGSGDDDKDLITYALGGDGDGDTTTHFDVEDDHQTDRTHVHLRRRHGSQPDVTYTVQVCPDLSGARGTWEGTTVIPNVVNNGDGTETVTFPDVTQDPALQGEPLGFTRLIVQLRNPDGSIAQTSISDILGWQHRPLEVRTQTYGLPFVRPALSTNVVTAVTGNALTVGAAGTLVAGEHYYVEVIKGVNEGQRFEVDEAATTAASIALLPGEALSTLKTVPAFLVSDTIALRPHWRVKDLFPPAEYTAGTGALNSDQVQLWDAAQGKFIPLFLGDHPTLGRMWVVVGGSTSENDRIIGPADGLFVKPRQSLIAAADGQVRTWKFACPLLAGTNLIGNPYPVAQSFSSRQMTLANGFTGNASAAAADRVNAWSGDTSGVTTPGYVPYSLAPTGIWFKIGEFPLVDRSSSAVFEVGTASFINSKVANPGWIMPAAVAP